MKTSAIRALTFAALTSLLISCSAQSGAANDTSGANGATNGSGKVSTSDNSHRVNN